MRKLGRHLDLSTCVTVGIVRGIFRAPPLTGSRGPGSGEIRTTLALALRLFRESLS